VVQASQFTGRYELTLGEPAGGISPRLERVVAAFGNDVLQVNASECIRQAIWSKIVLNISSAPMAALTGARLKDLFASEATSDARRRLHREAEAIAAAMGYPVQIDFERTLAAARRSEHRASMAQDVLARRPLELDAICMVPLEFARLQNVPTPTMDLFVEMARLRAVEEGIYSPSAA
jgi:2-dehydropantoate 2-reductase